MPAKVGPELKKVNGCVDHRKAMKVTDDMTDDQKVAVALEAMKYKALQYYTENKNDKTLPFHNIKMDAADWYDWLFDLGEHNASHILCLALAEASEDK